MSLNFLFTTSEWFSAHSENLIKICLYGILLYWVFKFILWRILNALKEKGVTKKDREVVEQRYETLNSVISRTVEVIIFIFVIINILSELGINIAPMLAGFGIIGVAFGFGAQGLIKDIVNGVLIIAEGQYSKGDVVEITDKKGKVEKITLRRTVLRDLDGSVHHIPNSLVGLVSNKSQDWAGINIDVTVGCNENLQKVTKILDKISEEIYSDENFARFMLEVPKVLGVESFQDSKMIIKVIGKTKHLKRWEIAREFRRRIKEAFDREKIELV